LKKILIKRYVYDSLRQVHIHKHPLLTSLLLAASVWGGGSAAAADYDFNLHVFPNPFFAGKNTTVTFETRSSGGTATIYVYDFEGNLVKTFPELKVGSEKREEKWDGRGDDGNLIAPGPYVVVLEVNIQGQSYRDTFVAVAYR
jgi:flagellar hook assembly protein FlgD